MNDLPIFTLKDESTGDDIRLDEIDGGLLLTLPFVLKSRIWTLGLELSREEVADLSRVMRNWLDGKYS